MDMRCPARLAVLALCATLAVLPAPVSSAGGIYKWQDADGKTHFADKPPPDVEAETVTAPSASPADDGDAQLDARGTQGAELDSVDDCWGR